MGRDRDGRRRLAEIAVLRRGPDGWVTALTAWHADRDLEPLSGTAQRPAILDNATSQPQTTGF